MINQARFLFLFLLFGILYSEAAAQNMPDIVFYRVNVTHGVIDITGVFDGDGRPDKNTLLSNDNHLIFYFNPVDADNVPVHYQYRLVGLEKNWQPSPEQDFVQYNGLAPGSYRFEVKVNTDGGKWEAPVSVADISIVTPVWQQLWFKATGLLLALLLIWIVINYYKRKQLEQREELETEAVVNYFASQINSRLKAEDILWDVVANCISKLNFYDCVIYLIDKKRNVLVQKAAYGAKMEQGYMVHAPIEIEIGKGIVGYVASSGVAEIIPDTTLDNRYIVDDEKRYSEITVPLVSDGEVIGVIDSEHPKKNYFTKNHLKILSAIGVLCANQLQRARAEEENQKAKMEVLLNRQKAAESRLQSLRLQMNPHFLFNALNSVQQMILAKEDLVATKYLSRFSRLLRTVLVHSDKEMVTLREELEILNIYVELESVRFRDKFSYRIHCDDEIDTEEIMIPTLLVQPFVENAIWHGLMHHEGFKELKVEFSEENNFLKCIVEDNGVGREHAKQVRQNAGNDNNHKSKGIAVSVERLKNMHNASGDTGFLTIIDLHDENGKASGTRVELFFPV